MSGHETMCKNFLYFLSYISNYIKLLLNAADSVNINWSKTENGFEDKINGITLSKHGRNWVVTMGEKSMTLDKKASFDSAEGAVLIMRGM